MEHALPSPNSFPVPITPLGRVAAGSVLYRRAGTLYVTVVVKASFAFVSNGTMPLADPAPLARADAHEDDDPARSLRQTSDLMPVQERAAVLFVGNAYAPGGRPANSVAARLAVAQGERPILDKVIHVYGDRIPTAERPRPDPSPFRRMPIVYERTIGGLGVDTNPIGAGIRGPRGHTALPNLLYPQAASRSGQPAGFGPIPERWPSRARLLGSAGLSALEGPIAELDGINPAYFQAAPEDQTIDYLNGDEWILLENLNRIHPRMVMGLPNARAEARLYDQAGRESPVAMHLDMLFLEGEAERCSVTWRGHCAIGSEAALRGLRAVAGVVTLGSTFEWGPNPAIKAAGSRLSSTPGPSNEQPLGIRESMEALLRERRENQKGPAPQASTGSETLPAPDEELIRLLARTPFPIAKPGPKPASAPIPGAPWFNTPIAAPPLPDAGAMTEIAPSTPEIAEPPGALRRPSETGTLSEPAEAPFVSAPEQESAAVDSARAAEPMASPPEEPKPEALSPPAAPAPPPPAPQVSTANPSWPWASPPPDGAPAPNEQPRDRPPGAARRPPPPPPPTETFYGKFTPKKR